MANGDLNQHFGQYTLLERLGMGGMATVYRAMHNKHQKEVAVKVLHEHFANDEQAIKRLQREFQIASELKHPNIVPILASNVAEGRPYLVMPLYKNGTLADYFRQPREIDNETVLKILTSLASGLDYAHARAVIHRDFKLENILLGKENKPIISDFGIARIANTTKLTATGHFLGTPHYMAPEQAYAERNSIDHRADLYAFAVMAYLMLTGVFPFTSTDAFQLVIKHNTLEPPSPTLINDKLPRKIDAVLLKGLAKKPFERYQSADEFVTALKQAFTTVPMVTTIIDMELQNPYGGSINASFEAMQKVNDDETGQSSENRNNRRPVMLAILGLVACGILSMLAYSGGFMNNFVGNNAENAEVTEEIETTETLESTEEVTEEASGTEDATDDTPVPSATITNTIQASDTPIPATNTARPSSTMIPLTPTFLPTNTPVPPTPIPTRTPIPPTNTVRPSNTPIPTATRIPPTNTPVPTATDRPSVIDPVITVLPDGNDSSGGNDNNCNLAVGC